MNTHISLTQAHWFMSYMTHQREPRSKYSSRMTATPHRLHLPYRVSHLLVIINNKKIFLSKLPNLGFPTFVPESRKQNLNLDWGGVFVWDILSGSFGLTTKFYNIFLSVNSTVWPATRFMRWIKWTEPTIHELLINRTIALGDGLE